ncbi:MAG: isoamylase early set domain-containing protein [Caldilineaceae bacterium]|nr:isoamylase early set domain-containing protein [Caldilineaceae bacterium]
MIKKKPSMIPGHVCVVFELPASIWADRIYLTGDFNEWHTSDLPLLQRRDGVWAAELDLEAGRRYEFRYIIDGQWQTDNHADGFVDNEYGSQNSVLEIAHYHPAATLLPQDSLIHEQNGLVNPRTAGKTPMRTKLADVVPPSATATETRKNLGAAA